MVSNKGLEQVISIILFTIVAVSFVTIVASGIARLQSTASNTTESGTEHYFNRMGAKIKIDNVAGGFVYIRNTGSVTIPNYSITIYVDGIQKSFAMDGNISPNEVKVAQVTGLDSGMHNISVGAGTASARMYTNVSVGPTTTSSTSTTIAPTTSTTSTSTTSSTTTSSTTTSINPCRWIYYPCSYYGGYSASVNVYCNPSTENLIAMDLGSGDAQKYQENYRQEISNGACFTERVKCYCGATTTTISATATCSWVSVPCSYYNGFTTAIASVEVQCNPVNYDRVAAISGTKKYDMSIPTYPAQTCLANTFARCNCV